MVDRSCAMLTCMAICATLLFSTSTTTTTTAFTTSATTTTAAFSRHISATPTKSTTSNSQHRLYAQAEEDEGWGTTASSSSSSSKASDVVAAMAQEDTKKKTADGGVLPELKGDFDWDAKFGNDASSWITENVPGKIVLNEVELARQVTALSKLEDQWRKEREVQEYEADRKVGWVYRAETLNGRTAMFFLVTGLLTEYWTGFTLPGQVEEMLRIGGIIGFD